jgi:rhamnosyltransferase
MDQDSKFIDFTIWNNLKELYLNKNLALVSAASSNDRSDFINHYNSDFYERKVIMSSGTFVSIQASQKIGKFDETFFIDEIDHDYSLKCYQNGYKNISSYKIFLNHSVGEPFYLSFPMNLFKKSIIIHKPFRYYHIFRNGRIMIFRYLILEPAFSLKKILLLFKTLIKIILFYPNKPKYFFYIYKSLLNERN